MKGKKIFDLDYRQAKDYFACSVEDLEFLNSLSEEEKEGYHLEVTIDFDEKITTYAEGNWIKETEHLPLFNDKINNSIPQDDDFNGVCDFFKRNGGKIRW